MTARSLPLAVIADDCLPTIAEEVAEQVTDDGTASPVQMDGPATCNSSKKSSRRDEVGDFYKTNEGEHGRRTHVRNITSPSDIFHFNTIKRNKEMARIAGGNSSRVDPRFLHFLWRCETVERWIADKECYVRREHLGRSLASVHVFLHKQIAFNNKLSAYAVEGK